MKRRPQVNAPFILDFEFGEQSINVQWFNGKPIFRQGFQLIGSNGLSTVATNLQIVIDVLIDGYWAGDISGLAWFANFGTSFNGITIDNATGLLTVRHQSINLTDETIFAIVTYTKV